MPKRSLPSIGPPSLSFLISVMLLLRPCLRGIFLPEASPANRSVSPDNDWEMQTPAISGQPFSGSFAKLGRDTRWLRTSPGFSAPIADEFFAGILRDLASAGYDAEWGVLSACALGAPHTRERLFLISYPSIQRRLRGASAKEGERAVMKEKRASGQSIQRKLNHYLSYLEGGGQPNPAFYEWLMGFPTGHTELPG
jgi:hypothetical protein